MKLLLFTNAFLWWLAGDTKLPFRIKAMIDSRPNTILVSAASAWEISTKVRIGKLPTAKLLSNDFGGYLQRFHFEGLPITVEHARLAGSMAGAHKDPFDRMLAAQSKIEGLPLVTNDPAMIGFGVVTEW